MSAVTTHAPAAHEHHPDPNESYLKATHCLAGDGKGVLSWLTTFDHKRIGMMYLCAVLLAFLIGGVFAHARAHRAAHAGQAPSWTRTPTTISSPCTAW